MKILFLSSIIYLVFLSCTPSKQSINKQQLLLNQFTEIEKIVSHKQYRIEITEVLPLNTKNTTAVLNNLSTLGSANINAAKIDVNKQGYYIGFEDDKSKAELPFFGERRIINNYNSNNGGITFNSLHEDYKVFKNEKKHSLKINYKVNNQSESYSIFISILPSKKATITVNSSHTTSISYGGYLLVKQ